MRRKHTGILAVALAVAAIFTVGDALAGKKAFTYTVTANGSAENTTNLLDVCALTTNWVSVAGVFVACPVTNEAVLSMSYAWAHKEFETPAWASQSASTNAVRFYVPTRVVGNPGAQGNVLWPLVGQSSSLKFTVRQSDALTNDWVFTILVED